MSMPQELFETALALPPAERADLAFQLLQSLEPPGEEISSSEFGAELHRRIEAHRSGQIKSLDLEQARVEIELRIAEGPAR